MSECCALPVCVPHAFLVPRVVRKTASDHLEVELHMLVSHHVGAGK